MHTSCVRMRQTTQSSVPVCDSLGARVHSLRCSYKQGDGQFLKRRYLGTVSDFLPACLCVCVQTEPEHLGFSKARTKRPLAGRRWGF